jgi:hypothetical protein
MKGQVSEDDGFEVRQAFEDDAYELPGLCS